MIFQDGTGSVPKQNFLYLDMRTTEDQVIKPLFLKDIHEAEKLLTLHTNAGSSRSTRQGYIGSALFWLDERGITNAVSLKILEQSEGWWSIHMLHTRWGHHFQEMLDYEVPVHGPWTWMWMTRNHR